MHGSKWTFTSFLKKLLKITGWIIFSVFILLIAAILIIRIPSVQQRIVQKAVGLAQEKLGAPISVGSITLVFPKQVVVKQLYVQDLSGDSLLYAGELTIDTDLWALLHHAILLNRVTIQKLRSHVNRPAASTDYNFGFILKKFQDTTAAVSPDTTSAPWKFSLGNVAINDGLVRYDDRFGGDQANLAIGFLKIDMNQFDPANAVYKAKSISLRHLKGDITQTKSTPSDTNAPTGSLPAIGARQINLDDLQLSWDQQASGQVAHVVLGTASLETDKVDLNKHLLALRSLKLENTMVSYQRMKRLPETPAVSGISQSTDTPWHLQLGTLALAGNTIQYYDFTQPVVRNSADYAHVWLSKLTVNAEGIDINNDNYALNLNQLSFTERNGFMLQELKGKVNVTNHTATVSNFIFRSNRSHLALNGNAAFSSLRTIGTEWPRATLSANVGPSSVSLRDIDYFLPGTLEQLPVKIPINASVALRGKLTGRMNDLRVEHLSIRTLSATSLDASGVIKGLPDITRATMVIDIDSLHTTQADVKAIVPDTLMPASVQLPRWVTVKGKFNGTFRNAEVNTTIVSDAGELDVTGRYDLDSAATGSYRGDVAVRKLAVGTILKQDSIGYLSMTAHVNGYGTQLKEINASVRGDISEFQYQNYTYHDISADGTLKNYFYSGKIAIKDKNLDFELTGELDYRTEVPTYKLTAELKDSDFKALHLSARPLRSRGTLAVKLATPDFRTINGTIAIRKVAIYNGKTLYKVDSLLFASIDTKKQTEISINSDIIDGSFKGSIHLASLPDVLERHFNSYFALQDTAHSKPLDRQDFKFSLTLKKTDLITEILFPSLHSFESSPITGEFNSEAKKLNIHAKVTRLHYEALRIDAVEIDVNSTPKSLTYSVDTDNLLYDSLKIPGLDFTGTVAHDSIKTKLTVLDSVDKQKYLLGAVFNSLKDEFQFRFVPGQVFMNYAEWKVPDDNYIRFKKGVMRANNFSISNDTEQILMETKGKKDSVIHVGFRQLDLENIFNIISGGKSIVRGRLNGDISLFLQKNNAFNATLTIADLRIMQKSWGEINLDATRISTDKFNVKLSSKGEHSDIKLQGNYLTEKPKSILQLTATVARMDLELIEPFSTGQIKDASGQIVGSLDISGTVNQPLIKGSLTFKQAKFTSAYVNTSFTLPNETLQFTGSGLTLANFTVLDDSKNTAVFKGSVITKNFREYTLDLSLVTKNFKILNTGPANNPLYYGKVKMNATAKVTGPLSQPVVDIRMGFSGDSEINYIVPTNSKGVIDRKGIVEFVDKHPPKDKFLASLNLKDTLQNVIKGYELTATVVLKGDEKFNIIIDPRSGDKLAVQGSTTLVVKIDPSGNMDLSGQYEITKGSYNFSFYKLVRRDFEILKGGTISWTGDPLDAKLNLQALYKLETSPLELLATQSTDLNPYKQAFPFLVYLTIHGELSAPEISFRLDMPDASKSVLGGNVYAAIQDINTRESDLNKQVFSLLVLKRFMADNPFENQATTSFSSNARSSVSGLLTEQLQRLSQNVKGIQLTVDLKSFDNYSTGAPTNQTKLQLGVSKTLLHNKLVVKLAGNVDIAGENTTQNNLTDYIGDLALEYKITSDGRLRLTGFRNSDYDMIDGELIKTGAGLIYIKDYNTLKELFKSNAKTDN